MPNAFAPYRLRVNRSSSSLPISSQPPAVGLEKFEVEPRLLNRAVSSIADIDLPPVWGETPLSPSRTPRRPENVMGVGIRPGGPERSPHGSAMMNNRWPRIFVVNARDAEEVSLRKEPRRDSAEVLHMKKNTSLDRIVF